MKDANLQHVDVAPRATGRHHGNLRNALLDAAHALVVERGVTGWTVTDVVRRVGVSSAAPYKHFRDREDLLAGLAARGLERLRAELDASMAAAAPGEATIRAFADGYLRFASRDRAHFEAAFLVRRDKSSHPGLVEASEQVFDRAVEAVRGCESARTARGRRALAYAAGAAVHGHAVLLVPGAPTPDLRATLAALAAWPGWDNAAPTGGG